MNQAYSRKHIGTEGSPPDISTRTKPASISYVATTTGIVDENIHLSGKFQSFACNCLCTIFHSKITTDDVALASLLKNTTGDLFRPISVATMDNHCRPFLRQHFRDLCANTTITTGNQRDFSEKLHIHFYSPK